MINYNFGDIVLLGFPQTNMKIISKRPALIIYDAGDDDIIAVRITTQFYNTKTDYKIKEWKKSGLITGSFIRMSKAATLEKKFVINKLGKLPDNEIRTIRKIIIKMYKE